MANAFSAFERDLSRSQHTFTVSIEEATAFKELWESVGYFLHAPEFRQEAIKRMVKAFVTLERFPKTKGLTITKELLVEIIEEAQCMRPAHRARTILLERFFPEPKEEIK